MTDIHTHILPGIDDGATDTETSAGMLRALSAQGVKRVAFTPHYYGWNYSPRDFLRIRDEAYEKIEKIIPQDMEIALGAELHFSETLTINEKFSALSLGDTRYILVELPYYSEWTTALFKKFRRFIDETNRIPVIAHFCRYRQIRKNPAILCDLADMGCLLQFNTGSLLDKRAKKLVFAAMKHGLTHCVGTDCHNLSDRAPNYAAAAAAAKEAGYGEAFEKIEATTADVFFDRPVQKERYTAPKRVFNSYR